MNTEEVNFQQHWDKAYTKTPTEKLGWYEEDPSPTYKLLNEASTNLDNRIFIAGAGSTTLIDDMLNKGYSQLIASDISPVSVENLKNRIGDSGVQFIVDDLSKPTLLNNLEKVDIWIDRAVLHFLTTTEGQTAYFNLLKEKLVSGGYALFAEFTIGGATKCCGLNIKQYNNEMLQSQLGDEFELTSTFDHTYFNPNGDPRKYIYSLFKRK